MKIEVKHHCGHRSERIVRNDARLDSVLSTLRSSDCDACKMQALAELQERRGWAALNENGCSRALWENAIGLRWTRAAELDWHFRDDPRLHDAMRAAKAITDPRWWVDRYRLPLSDLLSALVKREKEGV